MKSYFFLIILMAMSLIATGQHSEPQRKDTRIIIEPDTSKGTAFDQMIKAGTSSGFAPALIQPQYNLVSWSDSKQSGYTFTLYTTIENEKIIITGAFVQSMGVYGSAPGIVSYRHSEMDTRRKCWDLMQKVADSFKGNAKILYGY